MIFKSLNISGNTWQVYLISHHVVYIMILCGPCWWLSDK